MGQLSTLRTKLLNGLKLPLKFADKLNRDLSGSFKKGNGISKFTVYQARQEEAAVVYTWLTFDDKEISVDFIFLNLGGGFQHDK